MKGPAEHLSFTDATLILSNVKTSTLIWTGVVGLLALLIRYLQIQHDPREPPVIPQGIPYVGHLIGIFRHGLRYYQVISERTNSPIYTLDILSSTIYVVTTSDITAAVQRNSKTLSFNPFMTSWLQPLYNMDDPTMTIMKRNMDCEEGDFGYMKESYDLHHGLLASGPTLNRLRDRALSELATLVDQTSSAPVSTEIYGWVQHVLTVLNTNAMWGPKNPLQVKPELEKDFWVFENKFHLLLLDVLPKYTSLGALQSREKVSKAWYEYHKDGVPDGAAELVQERVAVGRKYGLSTDALARLDVGLAQALLINTVPISAWMLLHIFSSPSLLSQIRGECAQLMENGILDHTKIREKCPLLVSTWLEVLRFTSYLPSGRHVLEDTVISDRYLLRKGATVLIPSGILHADSTIWGPDAAEFDPRRFLKKQHKNQNMAFRGFGGGTLLCPGRHFAFTEVLTFVATMVLGFDITHENGGVLTVPERDMYNPSLGVLKPVTNTKVSITPRVGFEGMAWTYDLDGMDLERVGA